MSLSTCFTLPLAWITMSPASNLWNCELRKCSVPQEEIPQWSLRWTIDTTKPNSLNHITISNVNRLPKDLWVWLCSNHPQPKIPPETMKVGAHLPRKWRTRLHNALGSDENFSCVMRLMQQSFPISVGEWTRSPMVVTLKKETSVCRTWLTWTTWVSRAFSNNLSGR